MREKIPLSHDRLRRSCGVGMAVLALGACSNTDTNVIRNEAIDPTPSVANGARQTDSRLSSEDMDYALECGSAWFEEPITSIELGKQQPGSLELSTFAVHIPFVETLPGGEETTGHSIQLEPASTDALYKAEVIERTDTEDVLQVSVVDGTYVAIRPILSARNEMDGEFHRYSDTCNTVVLKNKN